MTVNSQHAPLIGWFQQQQTPPGWFDLLTIMIDGMVRNVGQVESQPFLRQMGETLAAQFPLPPAETVGELEAHINAQLRRFGWGFIDIEASDTGLTLRHQAMPISRHEEQQTRWCHAFCAILEGLYASWLQSQGGEAHVALQRERLNSLSDVLFRYHNPQ